MRRWGCAVLLATMPAAPVSSAETPVTAPALRPASGYDDIASLTVTSSAFADGESIPARYSCEGDDISPPITWKYAGDYRAQTESYALIVDDPDAPVGTWVHWVTYNISPKARALRENQPRSKTLPDGGAQGTNSWRKIGYGGPCPPPGHGAHHYRFTVWAVDTALKLKPGATADELRRALDGHVLGYGMLTGLFERRK